MVDLMDLPNVACDDDWLEMGEGERGVVRGRLDGALRNGDASMLVSNAAWELTVVSLRGGYGGRDQPAGATVRVVVTRTEDGLEATTNDVDVQSENMT